jgi:TonB family protein
MSRVRKFVTTAVMALTFSSVVWLSAAAQEEGRRAKTKVQPAYPELAKRMNVTGAVKLMVTIAPNGTVKSAKVLGGHPLLVDPAIDAVKKWKYEPANEESTALVEFKFDNNSN